EKWSVGGVEKTKGKELGGKNRKEKSNGTTRFVWRKRVRTEIIGVGGRGVDSYAPADGKVLWELKEPAVAGRNQQSSSTNATPVGSEDMLYVGRGTPFGGSPLWALKAGASGDISLKAGEKSNAHIAWSSPKAGPPMASPLLYKDRLYILPQWGNILSCYDAKTGKEITKLRLEGAKGFTSSPWVQNGKVCCLDETGQAFVLDTDPEIKVVSR